MNQRCLNCPYPNGAFVPGEGPPDAKVMIVGEYPGKDESRYKRPFVGASGQLLDKMLQHYGIDRKQCFLTNVIKCHSSVGNKKDFARGECLGNLAAEFKSVNPDYILTLGSIASEALDSHKAMSVRGFVRDFHGKKLLATLHPSTVFRTPELFDLFAEDIQKFARLIRGQITPPSPEIVFVENFDVLRQAYGALLNAEKVAFDIEATSLGLGETILTIAFCDGKTTYAFNFQNEDFHPYIRSILEAPSKKIGQNMTFDVAHLRHNGFKVNNLYFDTMVAHHLIRTYLPHGLNALITLYTDIEKYDDSKDSYLPNKATTWDKIPLDVLLRYNAMDSYSTYCVAEELMRDLIEYDLADLFFNISMPLLDVLVDMRMRGVKINVRQARKVAIELDAKIHLAQETITQIGGPDFNPKSAPQLRKLLFETLKLPVQLRTKTGAPSTNKDTLTKLQGTHPIVDAMLEHRSVSKIRDTFVSEKFFSRLDEKNRIHTTYKVTGTTVGRLSSEAPNLQNIPRGPLVRNLFTVPEGFKFVESDYCVAVGTRVATQRGSIPIEQVRVGDHAIQEDGTSRIVSKVFNRGVRRVFRLTVDGGLSITCTADHAFRVIDKKGDYQWRKLKEFRAGDYVVVASGWARGSSVKLPRPVCNHFNTKEIRVPSAASSELAKFAGYLTGDGSFLQKQTNWVVCAKDKDVDVILRKLSKQLFGLSATRKEYRGVVEGRIHRIALAQWLYKVGVCKTQAPSFVLKGNTSIRAAWLSGLFEADGSVSTIDTGRISFCSKGESLARDVHHLLLSLGISSSIRRQRSNYQGVKRAYFAWHVVVRASGERLFFKRIGFLSSRKNSKLLSLLNGKTHHFATQGLPNQGTKIKRLKLSGAARFALRNTVVKGVPITSAVASRVGAHSRQVYDLLGLEKVAEWDMLFCSLAAVAPVGKIGTFDIEVQDTHTFIAEGFVTHNSQAELRVAAYLSRDQHMMDLFESGQDVHRMVAARMFHKAENLISKEERILAKFVDFGINYGRGWESIATQFNKSDDEAKDILRSFTEQFPDLMQWFHRNIAFARKNRYLVNPFNRRRWFPMYGPFVNPWEREARAYIPQSTVADVCSRAMIKLNMFLKQEGFKSSLIMNLHDAIMFEIADEELDTVLYIIKRIMEEQVPGMGISLPVDIEVENCWKEEKAPVLEEATA